MKILRNNTYSDKEPTIRIGHWDNKKKFSELTDKQLRNIANYENEEHPGGKRVIKISTISDALAGGCIGRGVTTTKGRALRNTATGALIGTAVGLAQGVGLNHYRHKLHTKQVKYAKEEIARREKRKNKEK